MPSPSPNTVTLLDMPAFVAAIEADLDAARKRILVETYIFRADRFARLVGERLAGAASRGLDVCLLFDGTGSREGDPAYLLSLQERGVRVRPYRRSALRLGRLGLAVRDHSRILVVDDAAYTGGYAFADPWLPIDRGGQGWHDLSCRVRGPAVDDFVALFERRWGEALGRPPEDFDTGARHSDVRLVGDGPAGTAIVETAHIEAFEAARQRIWIEHAYYYPRGPFIDALGRAARRNVDVRMLLPGQNTLPIMARAARGAYRAWLRAGLRIFEYLPTVLHSKVALVDDRWGTVGTYNANPVSVRISLELNVVCGEARFLAALGRQLEQDLSRSREITPQSLAGQSRRQQLGDQLAGAALHTGGALLGFR
jgi:cardiolipin synthase